MLKITRGPGQSLIIGDDITITVLETHLGWVRLGIEAPREMAIIRDNVKSQPDDGAK